MSVGDPVALGPCIAQFFVRPRLWCHVIKTNGTLPSEKSVGGTLLRNHGRLLPNWKLIRRLAFIFSASRRWTLSAVSTRQTVSTVVSHSLRS